MDEQGLCILGSVSGIIMVIALLVRIEHRLTKVETLLETLSGRRIPCQPNSDANIM